MAHLKELRYSTSSYRVKPNALPNLKIKVKLSKVTSNFQVDETSNALSYSEEFVFSWQQKVFSPSERIKYSSNLVNPSVIEEKYIHDVKIIKQSGGFPTKRLFSYVNHDSYVKKTPALTTQDPYTLSYIGEMVDKSQHNNSQVWKSVGKYNPVLEDLSENRNISNHYEEEMFIMADLGYPVNDTEDSTGNLEPQEVILCRISVNDNGCLIMQPDFTKSDSLYLIENPKNKENFEYSIRNVSTVAPSSEKEKEMKLLKELYARSTNRILSLVGSNLDEKVPNDSLRLFVSGEIAYAYDFEHQNIYAQYFVDVPEDWIVSNLEQLTGITQLSRGKTTKTGYISYFSFPIEFDMLYQKNIYKEANLDESIKWPIIYIEVFSIDSWTRYRTEGYGYTQIPTTPGVHLRTIPCWRPVSNSITNELRRYFVGGSAELEDLTFTSIPATFEGKYLSKYGFRTASTGYVVLKMNCLQQSNSFVEAKLNKSNSKSLVNRISGSNIHFGVMEVIKRFQNVKSTLLKVRQAYVDNVTLAESFDFNY